MAHIFISYSHKDKQYEEALYNELLASSFSPQQIWYDADIQAGERWASEIEKALEDSVILVLIVTPNSLQSKYVNYEWARAVGSGITVFPLLFEDVSGIGGHPVLDQIQYTDCKTHIASGVAQQIRDEWEINLAVLLGREIAWIVVNFRVLVRVVLWGYPYEIQNFSGVPPHLNLVKSIKKEADDVAIKLLDYSSTRFSAFTRKQQRQIHKVAHAIENLSQMLDKLATHTQFVYENRNYLPIVDEIENYRKQYFEPIVSSFAQHNGYEEIDEYLKALSAKDTSYSALSDSTMHPAMSMTITNLGSYCTEVETWITNIKASLGL